MICLLQSDAKIHGGKYDGCIYTFLLYYHVKSINMINVIWKVIRASNFRGMDKYIQKIETLIFILKIFRSEG